MNVECLKKIGAARLAIVDPRNQVSGFPYFARGVNALIPVEDSTGTLDTMAVDKYGRMYFNASFVQGLSVHELSAVIVHETQHILLAHHARHGSGVDHKRWNIVGDLEINSCARLQGALPDGCLTGKEFNVPDGKLAEWYLSNVEWEEEDEDDDGGDGGQDGDDQDGGGESDKGEHGTGAGKGAKPWELGEPEDPADALDAVDIKQLQDAVAEDIQGSARARGDLSGDMLRKFTSVLERPKVTWQQMLRMHVQRAVNFVAGQTERSYRRASLFQACVPHGTILPGGVSPVPEVSIVIDTSGSMSEGAIKAALSESQGIIKVCAGGEATMFTVDSRSSAPQKLRNVRDLQLSGGGGTDMRVGISAALEHGANIIIVMTDGYTPWPEAAPRGTKVICCLVGNYVTSSSQPSWMPTITVE